MIEVKLSEDRNKTLTTNDLQWFQDAVLAASGHSNDPIYISVMGGVIEALVPGGENSD
jgi:hypothetical protein